jgi:hypothetical protein
MSSAVSQQNPVRLFVSHVFQPDDDYYRVFEYLESSHNFYYHNCSDMRQVPQAAGPRNDEAFKEVFRQQIGQAEVVIIPSAQYRTQKDWVEFQLNCAKGLEKPVIVLEAFGVKEKLPVQLQALADAVVEWNERALVDAIKLQARHEETSRWEVIEFKLD